MFMNTQKLEVIRLIKDEYKLTEGFGKLFLAGMLFNIPVFGSIPYFSQIATVIILSIFLKKYLLLIKSKPTPEEISNLDFSQSSKIVIGLILITMFAQLVWIPFMTQLATLILLGILYAVFSKYKKKM